MHSLDAVSLAENKRIYVMTSAHRASDNRIFEKECVTLAAAGFDVTLLAPGNGSGHRRGVRFRGLGTARSRLHRMLVMPARMAWHVLRERPDAVHIHDPELIPLALLVRMMGTRIIYDAHEDLPLQVRAKPYIRPSLFSAVEALSRLLVWLAGAGFDLVVAATPDIASSYPKSKTVVVRNYPIASELEPSNGDVPLPARRPRFIYVGAVTHARGAKEMLRAVQTANAKNTLELVLAGDVDTPTLRSELSQAERVLTLGWCDRAEIRQLMASSVAGLVTLHPIPSYVNAIPTKMYEYMSAGLPVIASDFPEWQKVIREHNCGLLVDPLDPEALASAMLWILDNRKDAEAMGKRGRDAVKRSYCWEREGESLLTEVSRLLGANGAKG